MLQNPPLDVLAALLIFGGLLVNWVSCRSDQWSVSSTNFKFVCDVSQSPPVPASLSLAERSCLLEWVSWTLGCGAMDCPAASHQWTVRRLHGVTWPTLHLNQYTSLPSLLLCQGKGNTHRLYKNAMQRTHKLYSSFAYAFLRPPAKCGTSYVSVNSCVLYSFHTLLQHTNLGIAPHEIVP